MSVTRLAQTLYWYGHNSSIQYAYAYILHEVRQCRWLYGERRWGSFPARSQLQKLGKKVTSFKKNVKKLKKGQMLVRATFLVNWAWIFQHGEKSIKLYWCLKQLMISLRSIFCFWKSTIFKIAFTHCYLTITLQLQILKKMHIAKNKAHFKNVEFGHVQTTRI